MKKEALKTMHYTLHALCRSVKRSDGLPEILASFYGTYKDIRETSEFISDFFGVPFTSNHLRMFIDDIYYTRFEIKSIFTIESEYGYKTTSGRFELDKDGIKMELCNYGFNLFVTPPSSEFYIYFQVYTGPRSFLFVVSNPSLSDIVTKNYRSLIEQARLYKIS